MPLYFSNLFFMNFGKGRLLTQTVRTLFSLYSAVNWRTGITIQISQ